MVIETVLVFLYLKTWVMRIRAHLKWICRQGVTLNCPVELLKGLSLKIYNWRPVSIRLFIVQHSMDIPHETVLPAGMHNKRGSYKVNRHWRNILETMLHYQDGSGGGVIWNCIRDALASTSFPSNRNFKMNGVTDDTTQRKDESEGCFAVQGQCQRLEKSGDVLSQVSETSIHCLHTHNRTLKCANVFREILLSEKFALLCDLLQGNFHDVKLNGVFDLSMINSRMGSGYYEQFPELFDQDIQLVWRKLQKIGDNMVSLASSLSGISRTLYKKQVGEGLACENAEQKFEVSKQVAQRNNTIDSHCIASEFPCELYHSAKPDQTKTSSVVRASTSEHCGDEADGKQCMTFDGCEPISHFIHGELATDAVPIRSWDCASCSTNRCFTCERTQTRTGEDKLHGECEVCKRLEVPGSLEDLIDNGRETAEFDESRESSISRLEPAEQQQVPMVAISSLCKLCGTYEDDDRRFLVCGNPLCPYKYYHISCLKSNRVTIHKQSSRCWYCPSCLCRVCLSDKDDDMLVMCDGCDEAYHTYCMRPPCTAIPSGKWYCVDCHVVRTRQGMRRYERRILQQHGNSDVWKATGANKSVDMLLRAAEKLSSEESLAAGKKDK
ncbi:Histone-lysine N-methyltransferase protein [Dioscorea alata]|uniref:Histone-lysine N-methyltransferase protein n=4 Tax=Dioscorea alata TaxID=55571 RepID=A0ACB7WBX7_DIOAL|nr:Histone-lysine N-methyltransferase protein [Dioscorea alata]KAH7685329.1 Histone-lysine N-methyltransferase protein [Dioscorea alata]KAH7685330.1 Histone-lysine N-methyltransferase protein [Dioscorea alata]KAH7685331.1 Histone-lysine N-methyltransferase protein [Dioscorea alata]